uniref:Uncharacterized protein n=1 Tax=Anguilla anguilla TaxID=7936 RepID=A0A0E9SNF7_ANGAN
MVTEVLGTSVIMENTLTPSTGLSLRNLLITDLINYEQAAAAYIECLMCSMLHLTTKHYSITMISYDTIRLYNGCNA